MHCIRKGLVKVYKLTPQGEEQIIRVLGGGEIVGYRAVLAAEAFGATAETLVETMVCTIPADVLISLVRQSPDFALDFLAKLAQELRISEDELINLWHRTVRQRLAAVLLVLAEGSQPEPPRQGPPVVRMSRRDLARLIATTPESVSRALRRLGSEGAIECDRSAIRLVSLPSLRKAARQAELLGT
jgi:CRP-like cAMP-binding protein